MAAVVNEYSGEHDRNGSLGPYSLGFTPTLGNALLLVIFQRNGGTFSDPAGWTLVGQNVGASGFDDTVVAWVKESDGTETTISVPSSTGGNAPSDGNRLVVLELSGVNAVPVDANTSTGSGTALTSPSVSPTSGADAIVFGAWTQAGDAGRTFTPGAGYTDQESGYLGAGFHPGYLLERAIVSPASGAYAPDATSSVSAGWRSLSFALSADVAPVEPGVTFEINAVEFTGLLSKELRVELNGTGYVHFSISRGDAQATEANLARGNLIQVTIPEIHSGVLFEAILEEGDFDLLSSDEEGGQELQFGGPGTLAVLKRSVIAYEEYLDGTGQWKPNKGRVVFDADVTEGHIVNKLIREAQAAGRPSDPIPMVTKTFDATDDSNGDPWGDETLEGNWKVPMGSSLYDEVLRLVRAGLLHVEMAPGFELNLYRTMGTDRTSGTFAAGKVRFVGGVNIADGLARGMAGRDFVTHAYIRYGDGDWTNAAKLTGSFPYEQEMFFDAGNTSHANTARRAARGEMGWRETTQEALLLAHIVPWPGDGPDDAAGLYLPGPTWSDNGRYWVGDLVTVDTGSGEFDYDNATHRVYAITLREDATGYLAPPILELNAPYLSADSASSGLTASPIAGTASGSGGGTIKADLGAYQQIAEKGEADGYASLDGTGLVPFAELPVGTASDEVAAGDHTHAGAPLSNYAATTDPTTGDDSGDGYAIGSRWVNTTTDEEFVCTDATVGAAVWLSTTSAGAPTIDWGEDADISTLDYSDTPAAGALAEAARADHVHGMPAAGGASVGGRAIFAFPAVLEGNDNPGTSAMNANQAYLHIVTVPAPMLLRGCVWYISGAGSGTVEWGLFDFSSDATACTKLAGGSGALNSTGNVKIDATSAPVSIDAGTYALIYKAPATNAPTTYRWGNESGSYPWAKTKGSYTWDDTPDITTGWSSQGTVQVMCWLIGDVASGVTW